MVADGDMIDTLIGILAWYIIGDFVYRFLRDKLHDYLAALDGLMEAETTEEQL